MKRQEFEKAVLKLAFETDTRITTASIAYYFGIPSREANALLNELLEEGVLEFDSDSSGNLFYKIANHDESALPSFETIHKKGVGQLPKEITQLPSSRMTTINASEDVEAVSIRIKPRPLPLPNLLDESPREIANMSSVQISNDLPPVPRTKFENIKRSPIKKVINAAPDGNLGSLSSFVIAEETRCDPRPIVSRRAELATCEDLPSHLPQAREAWFSETQANDSHAMISRDHGHGLIEIDRPEHQPGMALLLSLILPGTGQIYNNEVTKGVTMMVLCFLLWFVLLGWVVQIWSIVDAVVVAEKINRKPGEGGLDLDAQPQT